MCNDKPKKTLKLIMELIKETKAYEFNETDLYMIKSAIYSILFAEKSNKDGIAGNMFDLKPEDLHMAAIRFCEQIQKFENINQ